MNISATAFEQWFISAFLIGFGILVVARVDRFGDPAYFFKRELRDRQVGPRFKAVLDRRRSIEAFPRSVYTIVGSASIVFGVLTALKLLIPIVAYANLCLVMAVTMGVVFVRMRNRSERRAAALSPRSAGTAVHPLWYGCAAVCALLPLVFLVTPLKLAAVLVTLSSLGILAMSVRTATMASILTGEDNELELSIDERLRTARVALLLCFAYTVPFVFFGIGTAGKDSTFYQTFAFAWCAAFWLAYFSWFVVRCYFGNVLRLRA